jgi:hypothetical protein
MGNYVSAGGDKVALFFAVGSHLMNHVERM